MFKKFLIFLTALAGLTFVTVYSTLNSHWFYENLGVKIINHYSKNFSIHSLKNQDQHYSFPCRVVFHHVEAVVKIYGENYVLKGDSLQLDHVFDLSHFWGNLNMAAHNVSISSRQITAIFPGIRANINYQRSGLAAWSGYFAHATLNGFDDQLSDVASQMSGDSHRVVFDHFQSVFAEGAIKGKILLDYAPDVAYSMNLNIQKLQTKRLSRWNSQIFDQIDGEISGHLILAGNLQNITSLESDFQMSEGSTMKAALLGFIANYLPQSQERKALEVLIKTQGVIPLEKATVTIKNDGKEKLSSILMLQSRKLNLDLNVALDMDVEGGLQGALNHFKEFSQK